MNLVWVKFQVLDLPLSSLASIFSQSPCLTPSCFFFHMWQAQLVFSLLQTKWLLLEHFVVSTMLSDSYLSHLVLKSSSLGKHYYNHFCRWQNWDRGKVSFRINRGISKNVSNMLLASEDYSLYSQTAGCYIEPVLYHRNT